MVRQRLSTTGTMHDTVLLGEPEWLGGLVAAHCENCRPNDSVFAIQAEESVRLFRMVAARLGLPDLCLYQLRHRGVTEDVLGRVRDIQEVQVRSRGRWRTDASVRRYGKPAMLQHLLDLLAPDKLAFYRTSWERFEDVLCRRLAARRGP